jgi:basic membrane protein A
MIIITLLLGVNVWMGGQKNQLTSPTNNSQSETNKLKTTEIESRMATPINVAVVFALGGLGDKAFNDMAYLGLQKAQADGLCTFDYREPTVESEIQTHLNSYAAAGTYDLIIAVGLVQRTYVNETAKTYPSQPIVLIDSIVNQGNVSSVTYRHNEGSFLAGALAGLMTQTGRIGFIGGMDIKLIREFWAGYVAGALYEKNDSYIEVFEDFVGSWGDPATAKAQAEAMWAKGVDIIFAAAGASGNGVLESANEQGKGYYSIGVDRDQDYLYPGSILTSMMKRIDKTIYDVIKELYNDSWSAGHKSFGLVENATVLSPMTYTKDLIGTDKIYRVNVTLRNKITNNEIVVPENATSLAQWISDNGITSKIYTPRSKITITSNAQLNSTFPGRGTITDPCRIEGFYINDSSGSLIEIYDTTYYFRIADNLLNGMHTAGQGIFISNVMHGAIDNNTVIRTDGGIWLDRSLNNTITENTAYNNSNGIVLDSSSDFNTVSYNTLFHNTYDGIAIGGVGGSHNNTVFENIFYNNNEAGIIISDSTFNEIFKNKVYDNLVGINLGNSDHNLVYKNTIFNNYDNGISLSSSNSNTVTNNSIHNNQGWVGLSLDFSHQNIVANNNVTDHRNNGNGITLAYSNENSITNNIANNNWFRGIRVEFSSNNNITHNTAQYNNEDGIWLDYSHENLISNNRFDNNDWSGMLVENSENNTITKNILHSNDHDGIGLHLSRNNKINNNTAYNNAFVGIRLEISDLNNISSNTVFENHDSAGISLYSSNNNTVKYNTVYNNTGVPFTQEIFLDLSSNNILSNNTVYNSTWGVFLFSSPNNSIEDNSLMNSGIFWHGPDTESYYQTSVENNTVNGKPFVYWEGKNGGTVPNGAGQIYLVNCTYVTVTDQDISNTAIGIATAFSSHLTIKNNIVHDNRWGIMAQQETTETTISNNTAYNNRGGIQLWLANYNIVINNTARNNVRYGIILDEARNNIFVNNTIYETTEIGILLISGAENNTFTLNSVYDNGEYGIVADGSSYDNFVLFNEFSGNNPGLSQAQDDGSFNIFVYNYWSDWTSPDGNNDRIVDTPYAIDGFAINEDQFPLVLSPLTHYLLTPLILSPSGGETLSGIVTISWLDSVDTFGYDVTYTISYSPDGGTNWNLLRIDFTGTSIIWDTRSISDGTTFLFKVEAVSTGGISIAFISASTITIDNTPPPITIVSPTTQTYTTTTITITLAGDDSDVIQYWYYIETEDTQNQTWTSSVSRTFTPGTYTLHAYGQDAAGNVGHTSVTFSIPAPTTTSLPPTSLPPTSTTPPTTTSTTKTSSSTAVITPGWNSMLLLLSLLLIVTWRLRPQKK